MSGKHISCQFPINAQNVTEGNAIRELSSETESNFTKKPDFPSLFSAPKLFGACIDSADAIGFGQVSAPGLYFGAEAKAPKFGGERRVFPAVKDQQSGRSASVFGHLSELDCGVLRGCAVVCGDVS